MKKIILAVTVLAVTGVAGYVATTLIINNNSQVAAVAGTLYKTTDLANNGYIPTKETPKCPNCQAAEDGLKNAQRNVENITKELLNSRPDIKPGDAVATNDKDMSQVPTGILKRLATATRTYERAKEELARCQELKKAYCDGFEAGKNNGNTTTGPSSKPANPPATNATPPRK